MRRRIEGENWEDATFLELRTRTTDWHILAVSWIDIGTNAAKLRSLADLKRRFPNALRINTHVAYLHYSFRGTQRSRDLNGYFAGIGGFFCLMRFLREGYFMRACMSVARCKIRLCSESVAPEVAAACDASLADDDQHHQCHPDNP